MKTVIAGGGITGLSAGLFLKAKDPTRKIIILESSSRLGGWIRSERINNTLVEHGTRTLSFRSRHYESFTTLLRYLPETRKKIYGIPHSSEVNKNRYVVYHGKVTRLPSSPLDALRNPLTRNIPFALVRDLFGNGRVEKDDVSVYELFSQFDPTTANYLIGSFIHGVYGGDIHKWSAKMAFKEPFRWMKEYGSFLRGTILSPPISFRPSDVEAEEILRQLKQYTMIAFNDGISTLVDDLKNKLKKMDVEIFHAEVEQVDKTSDGQFHVSCKDKSFTADQFISAIPANKLSKLLDTNLPKLKSIQFTTLTPVHCIIPRSKSPYPPTFGVLAPRIESKQFTGIIMDSRAFPDRQPTDTQVITIMMTEDARKKYPTDDKLYDFAKRMLKQFYDPTLDISIVHCYSHVNEESIPQYNVAHETLVHDIRSELGKQYGPNFHAIGASFDGIGVPDCIRAAYELTSK